jgi:hypothetical protein
MGSCPTSEVLACRNFPSYYDSRVPFLQLPRRPALCTRTGFRLYGNHLLVLAMRCNYHGIPHILLMIPSSDALDPCPGHLDGHESTVVIPSRTPKPKVRVRLFADVDTDDVRLQHRLGENLNVLHREPAAGGRITAFEHDRVRPRILTVGDGSVVPARVRDARSVAGIVIVDVSSEVSERAKRAAELAKGTQSRF